MSYLRLIHLADIHIQDRRFDEYRAVWADTLRAIKRELTDNTVIVIAGDLFDTKTRISAQNLADAIEFLGDLDKLAHVVVIPGNHDMNMNTKKALDLITPIVGESKRLSRTTYWRESGSYRHLGVNFVVVVPDGAIPTIDGTTGRPIVGITHEDISYTEAEYFVNGLRQSSGMYQEKHNQMASAASAASAETGETGAAVAPADSKIVKHVGSGCRLNVQDFKMFDGVLAGHIHAAKKIAGNAAFCGSLVQQDFGESHRGHGFLVWDFADPAGAVFTDPPTIPTVRFVEIHNRAGFLTIEYQDGRDITQTPWPTDPISVRIKHSGCDEAFIRSEVDNVAQCFGKVREVTNPPPTIDLGDLDVTDIVTHENIIRKIVEEKEEDDPEFAPPRFDRVAELCKIHAEYWLNRDVKGHEKIRWTLKKFSFSGMFCYGESNVVDFRGMNGVNGVIAPNRTGKSSLFDGLIYTLYDHPPRGTKKSVANVNTKCFDSMVEIDIGGDEYVVMRSGGASTNIRFCKNEKDLTQDTIPETVKVIKEHIGEYVDALATSFATQDRDHSFARMKQIERRKLLARFLKFDMFTSISKEARDRHTGLKTLIKEVDGTLEGMRGEEGDTEFKQQLANARNDLRKTRDRIAELAGGMEDLRRTLSILMLNFSPAKKDIRRVAEIDADAETARRRLMSIDVPGIPGRDDIILRRDAGLRPHGWGLAIRPGRILKGDLPAVSGLKQFKEFLDRAVAELAETVKTFGEKYGSGNLAKAAERCSELERLAEDVASGPDAATKAREAETTVENMRATFEGKPPPKKRKSPYSESTVAGMRERAIALRSLIADACPQADPSPPVPEVDGARTIEELTATMKARLGVERPPYDLKEHKLMRKHIAKYGGGAEGPDEFDPRRITSRLLPTSFGGLDEDAAEDLLRISRKPSEKQELVNHLKNCQELRDIFNRVVSRAKKEGFTRYVSLRLAKLDELEAAYREYDKIMTDGNAAEYSVARRFRKELANIERNVSDWEESVRRADYDKYAAASDYLKKFAAFQEASDFRSNLTAILKYSYAKNVSQHVGTLIALGAEREESEAVEDARKKNDAIQEKMEEVNGELNGSEAELKTARLLEQDLMMRENHLARQIEKQRGLRKRLSSLSLEESLIKTYRELIGEKKGIPFQLLRRATPIIEKVTNSVLHEYADFEIQIDDDLDIFLRQIDGEGMLGTAVPIELASGYQKFAADVATRVGLMEIASVPLPQCLIIDEGFGCLDSENIQYVGDFLRRWGGSTNGILLVISHVEGLAPYIEHPLYVHRKMDGTSYVNNSDQLETLEPELKRLPAPPAPKARAKQHPPASKAYHYCEACKRNILESNWRRHESSAGHRIKAGAISKNP